MPHFPRVVPATHNAQQHLSPGGRPNPGRDIESGPYPSSEDLLSTALPQAQSFAAPSLSYRPSGFGAMSVFDPVVSAPQMSALEPIGFAPRDVGPEDAGPSRTRQLSADSGHVADVPAAWRETESVRRFDREGKRRAE